MSSNIIVEIRDIALAYLKNELPFIEIGSPSYIEYLHDWRKLLIEYRDHYGRHDTKSIIFEHNYCYMPVGDTTYIYYHDPDMLLKLKNKCLKWYRTCIAR